ncbi:hypothetical protein, variant 3 [Verruconis gallopava]|uniref:UmuC domain-containing protein n=1 Tax=Verruconis gallopava TaxID=253628 RepID=A0A0D2A3S4_9PEZI|nr:hypothetical protein, variant 1 [Verruconis gallopava]XP_016210954.1 hypothetical protein, variant 2 [Verruconis gallopava]XP_016210955.1 hypothetical protein, variant 3 [Verruconis gallopava]KIW01084.1 hypothetical protein, variant 1 [Verruconis gallopava]KIW01085.1 hypothetical protein, variant 2 [Verruconis gallopava]KIW01086.1 hypothetical protein, variant 3 [Verruconis gallopava]
MLAKRYTVSYAAFRGITRSRPLDSMRYDPSSVCLCGMLSIRCTATHHNLFLAVPILRYGKRAKTLLQVFLDVTDIIEYNLQILAEHKQPQPAFFHLHRSDPTSGFVYDATNIPGHTYPQNFSLSASLSGSDDSLLLRLSLGSHLAYHIRQQVEQQMGYTCTVGISTSKLLSKLVGNLNKPNAQTTLLPPYEYEDNGALGNVASFMDAHDIGKVPDIGFKMTEKLRHYVLKCSLDSGSSIPCSERLERTTVGDLRNLPGLNAQVLEEILAGPGMQRGVGFKTWCLLHGIDDTEVAMARDFPKQISIEDSYRCMNTMEGVLRELLTLSTSLLHRMRADLTVEVQVLDGNHGQKKTRQWLVHPRTLRLSTRPRPPPGADGNRARASIRISRSTSLPTFVFNLAEPVELLAKRLVHESLVVLFRHLHPERRGWDLSLINVAVTNMVETAGTSKSAAGRDIGKMFKFREKTSEVPGSVKANVTSLIQTNNIGAVNTMAASRAPALDAIAIGSEDQLPLSQSTQLSEAASTWDESESDEQCFVGICPHCDARVPDFALAAHLRFHEVNI